MQTSLFKKMMDPHYYTATVDSNSMAGQVSHQFENVRRDNGVLSAANSKDTAMFSSIVGRYRAWKRRETVRRELLHLTDRELQDIGISRSEIDRVVSQDDLEEANG